MSAEVGADAIDVALKVAGAPTSSVIASSR
jgi:hypothetical protein